KTVCATNSATCTVCTSPCIAVTKNCDTVNLGSGNTISGVVSNCGNVTLVNITVTDNRYGQVTTIASLAPHASQAYSKVVTNTTCGDFPDTVTATGANLCGGAPVTATANAVCHVVCPPCVGITKEVACFLGGNNCDTFREFAVGVQGTHADGTVQNPAFCYRITITNCADVTLTNVTVSDDHFSTVDAGDFSCIVNGTMAPHASCTFIFKVAEDTTDNIGTFRTNTVTIRGQSALTGQT